MYKLTVSDVAALYSQLTDLWEQWELETYRSYSNEEYLEFVLTQEWRNMDPSDLINTFLQNRKRKK